MFLWWEKVEGEKCISVQGSSVKGSSQQSSTSGPKVKGGAHYFQAGAHLLWGEGVGKRYYTGMSYFLPIHVIRCGSLVFYFTLCVVDRKCLTGHYFTTRVLDFVV